MSNNSKHAQWSEGRQSTTAEDMMAGLGFDENEAVDETVTSRGVVLLCNCQQCGWQIKSVIPWKEMQDHYLGIRFGPDGKPLPPPPGTMATRQGVIMAIGCPKCRYGKNRILKPWHEIEQHVQDGVRSFCLSPDIFKVAAQLRLQQQPRK